MSLRPRYSRAFKLDPPGTDSHRRTSSPDDPGTAKAPPGAHQAAEGGTPLPPKADQREEEMGPECAATHPKPSQPTLLNQLG